MQHTYFDSKSSSPFQIDATFHPSAYTRSVLLLPLRNATFTRLNFSPGITLVSVLFKVELRPLYCKILNFVTFLVPFSLNATFPYNYIHCKQKNIIHILFKVYSNLNNLLLSQ